MAKIGKVNAFFGGARAGRAVGATGTGRQDQAGSRNATRVVGNVTRGNKESTRARDARRR